jgi:hypothetical protein
MGTLADAALAEGEHALDERPPALAGGEDVVQVAAQPRAGRRVAQRHLAVAEDRAEDIVEVVRDAAGERAHGLEVLGAAQAALQGPQLFLGLLALRHVLHEPHHAGRAAGIVEEHAAPRLQPADGAVGMRHAVLGGKIARPARMLDRLLHRRPILRVHELFPGFEAAVAAARAQPVHRLELGRPAVLALAGADLPLEGHGARRLLRQIEHLLPGEQRRLRPHALGHVGRGADVLVDRAVGARHRAAHAGKVPRALGQDNPVVDLVGAPRTRRLLQLAAHALPIVRMQRGEEELHRRLGCAGLEAEHAELLLRPGHLAAGENPGPAAGEADALRLGQERLAQPQLLHRLLALGALARFAQRAAHRADDARQTLLQHVVGGADLHRLDRHLLAQRAGDEDEWQLGALLHGEPQGRHAVEGRQREVRQDQVVRAARESRRVVAPRVHPGDVAGDAPGLEHPLDELGILGVVLEVQDAQRRVHVHGLRTLPGGGSLITAQNTPSSLMALTNSWKSTGFTT